jgi:flagellar biosynthesis protein FlhG
VVTSPEPTAVTDGYAVIKAISREKGFGRVRLLVNLVHDRTDARRVADRVQMVSRRFLGIEVDWLGHIVWDDLVRHAVRKKRPFFLEHPRAPATQCVRAIAEKLSGEQPAAAAGGFFKRFASAVYGVLS